MKFTYKEIIKRVLIEVDIEANVSLDGARERLAELFLAFTEKLGNQLYKLSDWSCLIKPYPQDQNPLKPVDFKKFVKGKSGQAYYSKYWIEDAAGQPKARLSRDDDVILFDAELMIMGIKLIYLESRGLVDAVSHQAYHGALLRELSHEAHLRLTNLRKGPAALDLSYEIEDLRAANWRSS